MGTAVIEEDVVRAPRVMAGAAFAQPGVTAPQRAASRQAITEVPSSGRRRGLTKRHAVKTVAAAGTNDRGRVSDPPAGPEEGTQWKKSNEWFFTERGIKQWVRAARHRAQGLALNAARRRGPFLMAGERDGRAIRSHLMAWPRIGSMVGRRGRGSPWLAWRGARPVHQEAL